MVFDLGAEKERLEEELRLISCKKNQSKDNKVKDTMSALMSRHEHYENLIDEEKDKIKTFDISIAMLEKRLRDTRRKVPSRKLLESQRKSAMAMNTALENRIQQATVRLNGILAENTNLRSELETLLKDRDKFILQVSRLENLLMSTTIKKRDMMDQVTKAYSERDDTQSKMRTLKERIERDAHRYSIDLRKLQRALDHKTMLKSFVNTIAAGDDDDEMKKKMEGEALQPGELDLTLENFNDSIAHLQEMSGEVTLEILLSNYLQAENDNYTLFSYISGLNNEVTSIAADVRRLRSEINEVQGGQGIDSGPADGGQNLKELQECLKEANQTLVSLEGDVARTQSTLTKLREGTQELFKILDCDPKPLHSLLGGVEVTGKNLSVLLAVIEQRVQELSKEKNALLQKTDENAVSPGGHFLTSPEDGSEALSATSSSVKNKPVIPHVGHPNEDDTSGPTTHLDLMSSLRRHSQSPTDI